MLRQVQAPRRCKGSGVLALVLNLCALLALDDTQVLIEMPRANLRCKNDEPNLERLLYRTPTHERPAPHRFRLMQFICP